MKKSSLKAQLSGGSNSWATRTQKRPKTPKKKVLNYSEQPMAQT